MQPQRVLARDVLVVVGKLRVSRGDVAVEDVAGSDTGGEGRDRSDQGLASGDLGRVLAQSPTHGGRSGVGPRQQQDGHHAHVVLLEVEGQHTPQLVPDDAVDLVDLLLAHQEAHHETVRLVEQRPAEPDLVQQVDYHTGHQHGLPAVLCAQTLQVEIEHHEPDPRVEQLARHLVLVHEAVEVVERDRDTFCCCVCLQNRLLVRIQREIGLAVVRLRVELGRVRQRVVRVQRLVVGGVRIHIL